jgi:hypothetical protein
MWRDSPHVQRPLHTQITAAGPPKVAHPQTTNRKVVVHVSGITPPPFGSQPHALRTCRHAHLQFRPQSIPQHPVAVTAWQHTIHRAHPRVGQQLPQLTVLGNVLHGGNLGGETEQDIVIMASTPASMVCDAGRQKIVNPVAVTARQHTMHKALHVWGSSSPGRQTWAMFCHTGATGCGITKTDASSQKGEQTQHWLSAVWLPHTCRSTAALPI